MSNDLVRSYGEYAADSLSTIVGVKFGVVGDRIENATPLTYNQKIFLQSACSDAGIHIYSGEPNYIAINDINDKAAQKLAEIASNELKRIDGLKKGEKLLSGITSLNMRYDPEIRVLIIHKDNNLPEDIKLLTTLREQKSLQAEVNDYGDTIIMDVNSDRLLHLMKPVKLHADSFIGRMKIKRLQDSNNNKEL